MNWLIDILASLWQFFIDITKVVINNREKK